MNDPLPQARLTCKCSHPMEAMWESIDDKYEPGYRIVATVFHCNHCDDDTELIRKFTKEGELVDQQTRHYFFGQQYNSLSIH